MWKMNAQYELSPLPPQPQKQCNNMWLLITVIIILIVIIIVAINECKKKPRFDPRPFYPGDF